MWNGTAETLKPRPAMIRARPTMSGSVTSDVPSLSAAAISEYCVEPLTP